ncbi:hypothetical protein B0H17DRAFT_1190467 [Mycena rosella]|uniref:Uncharacterized protein n=1 Tax=Mycena rosella TaxID=1033263 RepID=A0AAD7MCI7_MYCRO|nr:hypothetical protein B0H17DRAFT_1190467 [Mycena rosella]
MKKALAARQAYQEIIRQVACDDGKKVSGVLKAIDDSTATTRKTSAWNAFQTKCRAEYNKKEMGLTNKEYRTFVSDKYKELFSGLSEDDAGDPAARAQCTEAVMAWYREKTSMILDKKKGNHGGHTMLTKVAEPFINMSTVTANAYDIKVCGFAIDTFSDNAIIWGGGGVFQAVYNTFEGQIKTKLNNVKAMFQVVQMQK